MPKTDMPPHARNKLCGAHARQTGKPCKGWAMTNGRCRLHGGKSTGAKKPHRHITHGLRTKEAIAERKAVKALLKASRELLEEM